MEGYDNSYDGSGGNAWDGSSGSGDWDSIASGTNTHTMHVYIINVTV